MGGCAPVTVKKKRAPIETGTEMLPNLEVFLNFLRDPNKEVRT